MTLVFISTYAWVFSSLGCAEDGPRVIFSVDLWHPNVAAAERQALDYIFAPEQWSTNNSPVSPKPEEKLLTQNSAKRVGGLSLPKTWRRDGITFPLCDHTFTVCSCYLFYCPDIPFNPESSTSTVFYLARSWTRALKRTRPHEYCERYKSRSLGNLHICFLFVPVLMTPISCSIISCLISSPDRDLLFWHILWLELFRQYCM